MDFEISSVAPESWSALTIEQICSRITSGGTPSRQNPTFYLNGVIPWVKTQELLDGWVCSTEERITVEALQKSSAKLLPKNTVLMAMYGATVGQLGILNEPMACNQASCALIVDDAVADFRYVYYLLLCSRNEIKSLATGAAQQNLSASQIRQFRFRFPDRRVQKTIADYLAALDAKIDLNRRINQTLEAMAQAIFKSWFVDFDPVKAKMAAKDEGRDPLRAAMSAISGKTDAELDAMPAEQFASLAATAALFPDEMVESELGDIPKGWAHESLAKMVNLIGGGTPKRSEASYWNGSIPWFSVKDAPAGGDVFVIETEEHITEEGLNKSAARLLPVGATIISARGTVGKLALVGVPMAMNQSCYGVQGGQGIGAYFNYFNLKIAIDNLRRNAHGAVFDTITQSTFDSVICVNPERNACNAFETTVKPLLMQICINLKEIGILTRLRDVLLPKLISGELSIAEAIAEVKT
jgi:type I restriction enzyme S subunit